MNREELGGAVRQVLLLRLAIYLGRLYRQVCRCHSCRLGSHENGHVQRWEPAQRQPPLHVTDPEPSRLHASFKRCRVFGNLDRSCFLLLACRIIVQSRSGFNVEDVRLQEPIGDILQHNGMNRRYKYVDDLPHRGSPICMCPQSPQSKRKWFVYAFSQPFPEKR